MANPFLPMWEYIPADKESEKGFFEACSMRKVGDTENDEETDEASSENLDDESFTDELSA